MHISSITKKNTHTCLFDSRVQRTCGFTYINSHKSSPKRVFFSSYVCSFTRSNFFCLFHATQRRLNLSAGFLGPGVAWGLRRRGFSNATRDAGAGAAINFLNHVARKCVDDMLEINEQLFEPVGKPLPPFPISVNHTHTHMKAIACGTGLVSDALIRWHRDCLQMMSMSEGEN